MIWSALVFPLVLAIAGPASGACPLSHLYGCGTGRDSSLPVDGVHAGVMNLDDVKLPDGAGYYLCGPLPFMQAVRSALLDRGVPARDIQYEVFGPDLWQADLATETTPGATDRDSTVPG